ncbi:methyltransferase domain-containing protein [Nonomuraea sp. NPDC000554]|uniref:methyltransferase domain-containing protein n=1 Tax=Nonomuraea sp. NPDC000554 TaxID=3154259 RepID=UPI003323CF71
MDNWFITLDDNQQAGRCLKYYSRAADETYWTDLWKASEWSYERQLKGHLLHELRATFRKWVKPGERVLEAGCGRAHFTVAADALGYRAEGLDWSQETISRLRGLFPDIPWHVGDVRKLDFADGVFDAVYSPGVCEHFEEGPAQILAETRRILRPGGIAIISTPCMNSWLQARARRFVAARKPEGDFYQYAFSPKGMRVLLEKLGFEVPQVRPYNTVNTLINFAGWKVPQWAIKPLLLMDYAPVLRQWGSSCVWVARRPLHDR